MKKKYNVIGVVGEGAYGIVYKCQNKETGEYVAIKKFKETEDEQVQKTMKRELKMLQQIKHPNIVEFKESFMHKGNLFLVFEYCEKNLLEVLEESPDGLTPKLIKSFIYQMCKAISYMHKNNLIHRDIKPENLLIDEKLNLKLCDFGFARRVKLNDSNNNLNEMTDYVATRWYRSPELLLSGGIYGPGADYWAVGCIMGELADGNPMFPGENETDQINCIIKILGNLPNKLVNMFYNNPIYDGKELIRVSKPETLERRYKGKLGPTAIDFMKGLLELDPAKRLNSDTVFKHKYFSCYMKDEQKEKEKEINNNNKNVESENTNNKNNNAKKNIKSYERNQVFEYATNNSNITNTNINTISLTKRSNETDTKIINNTTNINIINYNNITNTTNNIIEMHDNNMTENYNNNKSFSNNKNEKNIKNINKSDNILIKKSMIIKVGNNSQKEKSNILKNFNNQNNHIFTQNITRSLNLNKNLNNSQYNLPLASHKFLSMNKFLKITDYQNMSFLNKFPNIMTISLSQGKTKKVSKIKNNNLYHNSSTYDSFNNSPNKKNLVNYNSINNSNMDLNKKNKNNYKDLLCKTYLEGYKTFFNKNKANGKYNYDINTSYFKNEAKKYISNNSSLKNYNNNVIDENDEYAELNNTEANMKNNNKYFKKNYLDKKDEKFMTKYKKNNLLGNIKSNGKFSKNNGNAYGTIYNFGNLNKKKNVELPKLIHMYNNKNIFNKYNGNLYKK